jgi:hypothetical protein
MHSPANFHNFRKRYANQRRAVHPAVNAQIAAQSGKFPQALRQFVKYHFKDNRSPMLALKARQGSAADPSSARRSNAQPLQRQGEQTGGGG